MSDGTVTDEELLRGQRALQAEARRVLDELHLLSTLSEVGYPSVVGSLALGLMVWRDIDIEVQCPTLTADLAFETVRPLVSYPSVYRMTFHDWTGVRATPDLPEGYYWGVRYQPPGAEEWKVDIWLLPAGTTRRTGAPLADSLRDTLTDEARLSILRLKHRWHRLPTYWDQVVSTDIYDAVLFHDVRTPEEFDAYLRERNKPDRSGSK